MHILHKNGKRIKISLSFSITRVFTKYKSEFGTIYEFFKIFCILAQEILHFSGIVSKVLSIPEESRKIKK